MTTPFLCARFVLLLALALAMCSSVVVAATERVDDPHNAVQAFSRTLNELADSWSPDLGIDMQIVIIHNPKDDIAISAQQIFQKKLVGKNYSTGGILILVNTATDMARIAVSHNLEGAFTDAVCGAIAKSQLGPYASQRMLGMAIMDTLEFMKDHALLSSANGSLALATVYQNKPGNRSILGYYSGGGGGQVKFPVIDFDRNWKKQPDSAFLKRYAPSADPLATVTAYKNAMQDMVGYPDLDLLTEAAQVFRNSYPFAPYETYKRLLRIQSSEPLLVKRNGDRAVVSSARPAHGFIPIFLKQESGIWHVDEQEMYKNLFFDKDGNWEVRNNRNAYMFGLSGWGQGESYDISPLDDGGELKLTIEGLRKGNASGQQFMLAELLFRNAFAALEAIDVYEKAVSADPGNQNFRRTLGKRYMYLNMEHMAVPHLQKAGPDALVDLAWAYKNLGQCTDAKRTVLQYQAKHPESGAYNKSLLEWVSDCE